MHLIKRTSLNMKHKATGVAGCKVRTATSGSLCRRLINKEDNDRKAVSVVSQLLEPHPADVLSGLTALRGSPRK